MKARCLLLDEIYYVSRRYPRRKSKGYGFLASWLLGYLVVVLVMCAYLGS